MRRAVAFEFGGQRVQAGAGGHHVIDGQQTQPVQTAAGGKGAAQIVAALAQRQRYLRRPRLRAHHRIGQQRNVPVARQGARQFQRLIETARRLPRRMQRHGHERVGLRAGQGVRGVLGEKARQPHVRLIFEQVNQAVDGKGVGEHGGAGIKGGRRFCARAAQGLPGGGQRGGTACACLRRGRRQGGDTACAQNVCCAAIGARAAQLAGGGQGAVEPFAASRAQG